MRGREWRRWPWQGKAQAIETLFPPARYGPGGASRRPSMPARSKKQQMAAGAALAAKRGEKSEASLKGASRSMEHSMSEKQLEELASTSRKTLPKRAPK